MSDQVRDPRGLDALDHPPLVLALPAAETIEPDPPSVGQPAHLQPDPRVVAEQLGEGARGDRHSLVDDGHPVADVLGLLEEVGVQKDGRATVTQTR